MSFLESILLLQSILFPNLHLESSWPTSAITWIWWILTWLGQKQYLQRNDYNLSINSQGMLKGCSPCSPLFGAEGWRGNIAIIVIIIIKKWGKYMGKSLVNGDLLEHHHHHHHHHQSSLCPPPSHHVMVSSDPRAPYWIENTEACPAGMDSMPVLKQNDSGVASTL